MKTLVTGGAGFIGSHLVQRLLSDGYEVTVLDDESAPENETFFKFAGVETHKVNISEEGHSRFYRGVDIVFHLAARSRIQPSFSDPHGTYQNNVLGTHRVLAESVCAGVKRVVYAGSSSCYGLANVPPLQEHMTADCLNHYALSKKQGEELCRMYSKVESLETVVLRYFNVYGPREPLVGQYAPVVGIFKRERNAERPLTIVGTGEQRRDFTHVLDVVEANIAVATASSQCLFEGCHLPYDVFNVGTGKNYSVNEIADMVGGPRLTVPARQGEASVTLADNNKLRQRIGWSAVRQLPNEIWKY